MDSEVCAGLSDGMAAASAGVGSVAAGFSPVSAAAGVGSDVRTGSVCSGAAGGVVADVWDGSTSRADSKRCCWLAAVLGASAGLVLSCELSAMFGILLPSIVLVVTSLCTVAVWICYLLYRERKLPLNYEWKESENQKRFTKIVKREEVEGSDLLSRDNVPGPRHLWKSD